MRVLLLGSPSTFTSLVLRELLSAGVRVVGAVLPRQRPRGFFPRAGPPAPPGSGVPHPVEFSPRAGDLTARAERLDRTSPFSPRTGDLPVSNAADVDAVAGARGIPLIVLDQTPDIRAREAAARLRPDLLAIACYPRILDAHWLALAPRGALNLHPSLLPAYRGPSPLFWQFRYGEARMGITLHRASAAVDAGPLIAAAALPVAPGAGAGEVQDVLVRRGAALLVGAIERAAAGPVPEYAQDEARASCFGWPDDDAFRIPTSWSAERAFRFMRGVRECGQPFTIEARHDSLRVKRALDFETRGGVEGAVRREERTATIGFASGVLRVSRPFAAR